MQADTGQAAGDGGTGASALRRAMRRALAASAAPAVPPTLPRAPERAIAAALARAADRVHGLPLFFDRIQTGHAMVAELAEIVPDRSLVLVVEGPGDALGMVALCPGLTASLIEMQALGRVSAHPPAERRPTRTDAAVCADFVEAGLAELAAELSGLPGFAGMGVFRIASFVDDPRPLELMLDNVPHRRIDVRLRAGPAGQRDGLLILALPLAPPPLAVPGPPALGQAPPPAPGMLGDQVRSAPLNLQAVLCRLPLTLGQLRALSPGDRIPLPPNALDLAVLETAAGQPVLRGRLGELAGRHALRLFAAGGRGEETGQEPPMADAGSTDPFRGAAGDDDGAELDTAI